jgi:hypothetical protein
LQKKLKRSFVRGTGVFMRKLVFILLAFIAVATFIRAYDTADNQDQDISEAAISNEIMNN